MPKLEEELEKEYLDSLSKMERVAYDIAVKNLESSFDLSKSIGFRKWLKNKKIK
tara:strand:- start:13 stop:174 length:162 start_codon:yes stop_codon:yes gene_type:complete